MLSLGTGGGSDDEDRPFLDELLALKMIRLLQENGWEFNYSRDPLLILIEYEEQTNDNGENEES
jgi:hypothetical protein